MLERGYEDVYNWDINGDGITGEPHAVDADGDGLIDGSSIYNRTCPKKNINWQRKIKDGINEQTQKTFIQTICGTR